VIEFDGGNHRDRLVSDNRRQNLLVTAGYRVLRFTSADLRTRPDSLAAQVRGAIKTPPAGRSSRPPRRTS
jgi:very-short-patch-repair endonuclease